MINEERTLADFGYTSDRLTHGSAKRVWRVCKECGKEDNVSYSGYIIGSKRCQSCASKGKVLSEEHKKKLSDSHKGIQHSEESKRRQSKAMTGKNNPFYGRTHTEETKKMISENRVYTRGEDHQNFGKVLSDETRLKISENHANVSGENNPNWQGGITNSPYCEKFNEECRESNREKYGRSCFLCNCLEEDNIDKNEKSWKLSVHHIDMNKDQGCDEHEWKLVPLCLKCHRSAHHIRMISCIEYVLADESLT